VHKNNIPWFIWIHSLQQHCAELEYERASALPNRAGHEPWYVISGDSCDCAEEKQSLDNVQTFLWINWNCETWISGTKMQEWKLRHKLLQLGTFLRCLVLSWSAYRTADCPSYSIGLSSRLVVKRFNNIFFWFRRDNRWVQLSDYMQTQRWSNAKRLPSAWPVLIAFTGTETRRSDQFLTRREHVYS